MADFKMTDMQIITALLYCKHDDGKLCNICPYGALYGSNCSKKLNDDASDRIAELSLEVERLKGN